MNLFTFYFYHLNTTRIESNILIRVINSTSEIDQNQLCSLQYNLLTQFPKIANYRLLATSCCWDQSVNHQGDKRKLFLTSTIPHLFNLYVPNSTFKPTLVYHIANDCYANLTLFQAGLVTSCQWASQYLQFDINECGGICGPLPQSHLDSTSCTLDFRPFRSGSYQFAVMIQPRIIRQHLSDRHQEHRSNVSSYEKVSFPLQVTVIVQNWSCLGDQISISCLPDSIQVNIHQSIATSLSQPYPATINLGLCQYKTNSTLTHIKIPFNSCGNDIQFNPRSIIYGNTITAINNMQNKGGVILREQQHQLMFSCSYKRTAYINAVLNAKKNHSKIDQGLTIEQLTRQPQPKTSSFQYDMLLYTNQSYQQVRTNRSGAIYVEPNEEIFFEINVKPADPLLVLIIDTCYSNHQSKKHVIISQ
ncbi:Deleted in malignant brain tumors 1 protein, partial [Trichoplax sp. H2]